MSDTDRTSRNGGSPTGGAASERPLVLVVEDSEHDWRMYGKILWYNGFDVLHAASAEEGLRLAHRFAPDVVLLDIKLGPGQDGIELCAELKSDPATSRPPVIALTACAEAQYGEAAREAGFLAYLEKPVGPLDVLNRICELVGRPPQPGVGASPRKYSAID